MYAASVDIEFHLKTDTLVFVPRDLDLLTPKINRLPVLMLGTFYVNFVSLEEEEEAKKQITMVKIGSSWEHLF